MVTTEGQQQQVMDALAAGVSDYILKPFDSDTLKAKVEKHLPSLVDRLQKMLAAKSLPLNINKEIVTLRKTHRKMVGRRMPQR